jgi:hypothetical protein
MCSGQCKCFFVPAYIKIRNIRIHPNTLVCEAYVCVCVGGHEFVDSSIHYICIQEICVGLDLFVNVSQYACI